jgi:hypothetical protein
MNYLSIPASLTTALSCVQQLPITILERVRSTWAFLTKPEAIETYIWLGRFCLWLVELAYVCIVWLAIAVKRWVDVEVYQAIPNAKPYLDLVDDQFAKVEQWEATQLPELTDEEIAASFSSWGFDCEGYGELPEDDDQDSSDRYVAQPAQEALSQRIDTVMDRKAQSQQFDNEELPAMWEASDFDSPDYRIPAQPQAMGAPVANLVLPVSECYEDALDRRVDLEPMTLKQLAPIAEALGLPTRKVKKADLIASILEAEGYKL